MREQRGKMAYINRINQSVCYLTVEADSSSSGVSVDVQTSSPLIHLGVVVTVERVPVTVTRWKQTLKPQRVIQGNSLICFHCSYKIKQWKWDQCECLDDKWANYLVMETTRCSWTAPEEAIQQILSHFFVIMLKRNFYFCAILRDYREASSELWGSSIHPQPCHKKMSLILWLIQPEYITIWPGDIENNHNNSVETADPLADGRSICVKLKLNCFMTKKVSCRRFKSCNINTNSPYYYKIMYLYI